MQRQSRVGLGDARLLALEMEEGGVSQCSSRKLEKERKGMSLQSLWREHGLADTLIPVHGDPCQTSNLQNCKRISLCCLKHELRGNSL